MKANPIDAFGHKVDCNNFHRNIADSITRGFGGQRYGQTKSKQWKFFTHFVQNL